MVHLQTRSVPSHRRVPRQFQVQLDSPNESARTYYHLHPHQPYHVDSPHRAQASFRKITVLSVSVTALLSSISLLLVFSSALPSLPLHTTTVSTRGINRPRLPYSSLFSSSSSISSFSFRSFCAWFPFCLQHVTEKHPTSSSLQFASVSAVAATKNQTLLQQETITDYENAKHKCYLVTKDNELGKQGFPFNSRTFCTTGPTCVGHGQLYGAEEHHSECVAVDSSLTRTIDRPLNCSWLRKAVRCSQGLIPDVFAEQCPTKYTVEEAPKASHWIDGLLVVIPAYPHLRNIYHFAHALGAAAHVAASSPSLISLSSNPDISTSKKVSIMSSSSPSSESLNGLHNVAIVFRGSHPAYLGNWQKFMMDSVLFRLKSMGLVAEVYALGQELSSSLSVAKGPPICSKKAVLLGMRSSVNVWPFPTTDEITKFEVAETARAVPVESIAWRASCYAMSGVSSRLPLVARGASGAPVTAWSDLPPLAIGYARRQTPGDPMSPNDVVPPGMIRRLSDADEEWLTTMLSDEARKVGASFSTIETYNGTSAAEQVRTFSSLGLVVGLHGANLLNAMFMPPFSALVEISNMLQPCYRAGANSGLASWVVLASHIASIEESNCGDYVKCRQTNLSRRVMIDKDEDRIQIREGVQSALRHILRIRRAFSHLGAVPIVWEDESSSYTIDWTKDVFLEHQWLKNHMPRVWKKNQAPKANSKRWRESKSSMQRL